MNERWHNIRPEHRLLFVLLAIVIVGGVVAAAANASTAHKTVASQVATDSDDDGGSKITTNAPAQPASSTTNAGCDQSLWDHVYHPSRLKILDNCKTVSGTIAVIRHEKDGDYHILLQLDAQYRTLLNDMNKSAQHSDLVLEPVCEDAVTQSDAVSACQGYHSPVQVPAVGTHVYVTGSYVLDTEHGWNEIHPVSSLSNSPPSQNAQVIIAPQATQPPTPASTIVKLSRTDICHVPGDPYYNETTNFTPYPSLEACEAAGGRLPK